MKVKEFIDLVNSSECQEFSDIYEDEVELIKSRVNETWSFDDTYSTSMNVYKCEDGIAGVIGVCHLDTSYFTRNMTALNRLPKCIAVEVTEIAVPTFIPNPNKWLTEFMDKLNYPI